MNLNINRASSVVSNGNNVTTRSIHVTETGGDVTNAHAREHERSSHMSDVSMGKLAYVRLHRGGTAVRRGIPRVNPADTLVEIRLQTDSVVREDFC